MDEIFYIEDGVEVPPPTLFKPLRNNGYGSIQDLPDEELASPQELEHIAFLMDYEPVLLLPKPKAAKYNPALNWSNPDYNAFLSTDFDRIMPEFDKLRYKADKLKEQLNDVMITVAVMNEKIQKKVKYKLLRWIRDGRIEPDQIKDCQIWQLAKYYKRALFLKKEILRLQDARCKRQQQACEKWLKKLD